MSDKCVEILRFLMPGIGPDVSEDFLGNQQNNMHAGGVMVSELDLRLLGCGFNSRPFHFQVTTLGKSQTCACVTK